MTPGNHGLPYGANSSRPTRLEDENAMRVFWQPFLLSGCFLMHILRG
jgi:hypothetical protein